MRPDPWLAVLGGFILAGLFLPLKADRKPDPPQPNQPDQERGGTRPPDQRHPQQTDSRSQSEGGHPPTQSGEDGCSDEVRVRRHTKYEFFQAEELRIGIGCPVVFCSLPPPTVVWYKVDEAQIQINTSSRGIKIVWEQTKKLEGTSFLVFEKIHRNNSGWYQCAMKDTFGHHIRVQVYDPNETIKTKTTNQTPEENPELSTVPTWNGPLTEPACSDLCCQNFYRTLGVLAFFLILTAVCLTSKRCYEGRSRTRTRTRADPSLQMF